MKAWAIKTPEGSYVAMSYNGSASISWRKAGCKATDDKTKAKHYKTEGAAKSLVKRLATERRNMAKRDRDNYNDPNYNSGYGNKDWLINNAEGYEASADFIDKLTVVCVIVDKPNFSKGKNTNVVFDKWDKGCVAKETQGNCSCKCCGMYFKQIPFLEFGQRRVARICPWCMQEKAHEAQKILDTMNQERREEVEAERFIQRMG